MKRNLTKAAYGVLDCASYPVGMLLMGPIVLHRLDASEYGLWMIAIAVISTGGMLPARVYLLRNHGVQGLAQSRLCYGSVALLVYLPLLQQLKRGTQGRIGVASLTISYSIQEESKP